MRLSGSHIDIKTYFSIPVYRNILDMLNVFETQLAYYANTLNNILFRSELYNPTNAGFAISKIGKKQTPWYAVWMYNNELLVKAGLPEIMPLNSYYLPPPRTMRQPPGGAKQLHIKRGARFLRQPSIEAGVLINLSRNLEYEFNRIRLPLPFNFRQLVNKLNRTGNIINLWEQLIAIDQLQQAVNTMRGATRNEIDAANIATEIQEETIRLENEELITREQAAEQAQENLVVLNTEREVRLNTELEESATLQQELTTLKAELLAALDLLAERTENEGTTPETTNDIETISQKIVQTEQLNNDLASYQANVIQAANNKSVSIAPETREKIVKQTEIIGDNIPNSDVKKTNLLPIILGAAAIGSQLL